MCYIDGQKNKYFSCSFVLEAEGTTGLNSTEELVKLKEEKYMILSGLELATFRLVA
jgi:hypothetical protein